MATTTVRLRDGLRVGEEVHREAELREATVADLLDSNRESERLVCTPDGEWLLVSSHLELGLHMLRRQVKQIGSYPGPLTVGELKTLSNADLTLLQSAALRLEAASPGGAQRGESGSASAAAP